MSSDVLALEVHVFTSDFEFWIGGNELVSSRHSNSNFAFLIVIHHFSRCKLKVYMITHITEEKPSMTNWYMFIYSTSKFKVTCKNKNFECCYIRTHTKEKPSKISDITFAIMPFYQKKKKYLNWMAILSTLESTTLNKTIRCASEWFILA